MIKKENFKKFNNNLVYVVKYDEHKTMFWLVYENQGRVLQTNKGLELFDELTSQELETIKMLSEIDDITELVDEGLITDIEGDFDLLDIKDEASCIAQVQDINAQATSFTKAYNTHVAQVTEDGSENDL